MFSAHLWPYLVPPGLLAWTDGVRARRFASVICITAAVVLSAIQTGSGLMGLRALPGSTGQPKPAVAVLLGETPLQGSQEATLKGYLHAT
jgi:hypothetical protein